MFNLGSDDLIAVISLNPPTTTTVLGMIDEACVINCPERKSARSTLFSQNDRKLVHLCAKGTDPFSITLRIGLVPCFRLLLVPALMESRWYLSKMTSIMLKYLLISKTNSETQLIFTKGSYTTGLSKGHHKCLAINH